MPLRLDAGHEQAEGRVWDALKQVASAKEGALAWQEELKKLERQERAERSIDPTYFNSDDFKEKKREAIGNIHDWAEHAHKTIDSLDHAPMTSEELEYTNRTLRELDELASQYEQESRRAA